MCDCGTTTDRDFKTEFANIGVIADGDTGGFNISAGVRYSTKNELRQKVYERGLEFMDGNGLSKKKTPLYADEIKKNRDEKLSSINKSPEVIME